MIRKFTPSYNKTLENWLKSNYGSADSSKVLCFEVDDLNISKWRFFFGALNVPSHGGSYAVAVFKEQIFSGKDGLADFVKINDIYSCFGKISKKRLASIAMFFISRYGQGDVKLITNLKLEESVWGKKLSKFLHPPKVFTDDGLLHIQFWYQQRTLIKISLAITSENRLTVKQEVINDFLGNG